MLARWLSWLLKPLIVVLLLPIAGCGGILGLLLVFSAIDQMPSNVIRVAREQGNLAPLPRSATDLRTDGWSTGFSSARHIRFKAGPREIEQFLAASPGLKGVRPERFSPRHMYLPYPKSLPRTEEELTESTRHKYFPLKGPRGTIRRFGPAAAATRSRGTDRGTGARLSSTMPATSCSSTLITVET